MIRINKPTQAPAILRGRGAKAAKQLREQHQAEPKAFVESAKVPKFNPKIYGSRSVKNALLKAQHGKCAYCEAKGSHIAHGAVEHFRPKGGYQVTQGSPLLQPGYYWLAYDWSNLLFCCQICNQTHKGNHFPLADESRRAKSHKDDIREEQPLLIDPSSEDPAAFLEFNEEYIRAINGNLRGETTVASLGLNRDKITESRRDALTKLKLLVKYRDRLVVEIMQHESPARISDLEEVNAHLSHCVSDSGEYAAMVRAALRSFIADAT